MNHIDIIMLGLSRWDGRYFSSSLSLAKEFAKNNRVFYIDHPFTLKDFVKSFFKKSIQSRISALLFGKSKYKKVNGMPFNFTAVTPRLTFPINFLPEGRLYEYFQKVNNRVFVASLRGIIKDYEITNFIFINSFDPCYAQHFPEDIRPMFKIYQTVDDISQERYIARHGVRLENQAIFNSDLTLATSKQLTKLKSDITDKAYYLPNAVDISIFSRARTETLSRPGELPEKNSRIILYTGHIDFRVNYGLLMKIARENPDKLLLLVGPVSKNIKINRELYNMPNIIFAGQKNINELPAYLQHCHCAIIPFKCNTLTRSIYPLKINEYLAAGKPVVTTDFSEDIRDFKDVAYISSNEETFLRNIEKAIHEDSKNKADTRANMAKNNSWEARVEKFWKIIDNQNQKVCMTG